jgi:hypothetical protein
MRVQNSLQDPCPICCKETTLAVIEAAQPIPKRNSARIGVQIAGRSKLRPIGDVMESCRERPEWRRRPKPLPGTPAPIAG